jgi:flagellar biosynthesis/type III secretory pathway chaperone
MKREGKEIKQLKRDVDVLFEKLDQGDKKRRKEKEWKSFVYGYRREASLACVFSQAG